MTAFTDQNKGFLWVNLF